MKKFVLACCYTATVLLTACSVFAKLSEVEYNNKIVDNINTISKSIETTATLYNTTIPEVVSEKDILDLNEMENEAKVAEKSLANINGLLSLEARNIEQQNAVRTGLTTYQSAAENYLEDYQAMLNYYKNEEYKKDLSKVKVYDERLHTNYTTFIQANNDLVDTLESFVGDKEKMELEVEEDLSQ